MPPLSGIRTWVFDLDNTLYSAASHVFTEMDRRMADYVSNFLGVPHDEASKVQKHYYAKHGTTLKGLMLEHGMHPDDFLYHVHEVDLTPIDPCARLQGAIAALPGKKYVFTNGSRRHAERVTRHMGIDHLFDGMTGIEDSRYDPKPDRRAYDRFCDLHGVTPTESVFFEDLARNLVPAHALGFTTVLVQSGGDWSHEPVDTRPGALPGTADPTSGDDPVPHVHYVTDDLAGFLRAAAPRDEDPTP